MPEGFLYVLINPSMPGLAKVGKTTRNPSDRVSELSSATGIPSPFMLAYQQPVLECDSAEVWVHRELERGGYRTANNREFFNAPLHIIIQTVSQAANIITAPSLGNAKADLEINTQTPEQLADEIYELGNAYAEGTNSILKNESKAIALYEQAAALGHASACFSVAFHHHYGIGTRQDLEKSLTFYNQSIQLGHVWNEAAIADIFILAGQRSAAEEHWKKFFEWSLNIAKNARLETDLSYIIGAKGADYCQKVIKKEISHCVPNSTIANLAGLLSEGLTNKLDRFSHYTDKEFVDLHTQHITAAQEFIDELWPFNTIDIYTNSASSHITGLTQTYIEARNKRTDKINKNNIRRTEIEEKRKALYAEFGYRYVTDENGHELPYSSKKHPDFFNAMQNMEFLTRSKELREALNETLSR